MAACSLLGAVTALADGPPGDVQTAAFGPATSRLGYSYDVTIAAFNAQPVNAPSNTLTIVLSGGAPFVSISTLFGMAMPTSDTSASWLVDLPARW